MFNDIVSKDQWKLDLEKVARGDESTLSLAKKYSGCRFTYTRKPSWTNTLTAPQTHTVRLVACSPNYNELLFIYEDNIPPGGNKLSVYKQSYGTMFCLVWDGPRLNLSSKALAFSVNNNELQFLSTDRPPTEKEKRLILFKEAKEGLVKKFQPKIFLSKIKDMNVLFTNPNYSSFKGKKIPVKVLRVLAKDKILVHFETPVQLSSMEPIHYGVKAKFPYSNNFWLADLNDLVGVV